MNVFYLFGSSKTEKRILAHITNLTLEVTKLMATVEELNAKIAELVEDVTAEGDVVKAAVVAINGLTATQTELIQQLKDAQAAGDPVALQAAIDAIEAQNQALTAQTADLAAAIPAQPVPEPTPEPVPEPVP